MDRKALVTHSVDLKPGEEIVLHLADSRILDDGDEEVAVVESTRLAELERFRRAAQERSKIKEYKDRAGETGIVSGLDAEELEPSGPRPLHEAVSRNDMTERPPGERMAAEEEQLPTLGLAVARKAKKQSFKKRKPDLQPVVVSSGMDWDAIFGGEAAQETDAVASTSDPAPFRKPESWSLPPDNEEDRLQSLDLIKSGRLATVPDVVSSLLQAPEEFAVAESEDPEGVTMSKTEEFAKSLRTPLEYSREAVESAARKGTVQIAENVPTAGRVVAEKGVEDFFEHTPLDGGLATALEFLKKGGGLEEDKWKRGRHGGEDKLPLRNGEEDIRLDYLDAWGNAMNPKDAFRQMSYKFHGKGPGKKKTEKMLKRMVLERAVKSRSADELPPTLKALKAQQNKAQAYLVLNSGESAAP